MPGRASARRGPLQLLGEVVLGGIILASAGLGFARLRSPRPSETAAVAQSEPDESRRVGLKSLAGRAPSESWPGGKRGGSDLEAVPDSARLPPSEPFEAAPAARSEVIVSDSTPSDDSAAPAQRGEANAESLFLEREASAEEGTDSLVRALDILRARRAASDEGNEGATVERSLEALLRDHQASLDRLGVGSDGAARSPEAEALVRDFMALQGLPEAARAAKLQELAARFQISSPSLPEIPPSSEAP